MCELGKTVDQFTSNDYRILLLNMLGTVRMDYNYEYMDGYVLCVYNQGKDRDTFRWWYRKLCSALYFV